MPGGGSFWEQLACVINDPNYATNVQQGNFGGGLSGPWDTGSPIDWFFNTIQGGENPFGEGVNYPDPEAGSLADWPGYTGGVSAPGQGVARGPARPNDHGARPIGPGEGVRDQVQQSFSDVMNRQQFANQMTAGADKKFNQMRPERQKRLQARYDQYKTR